MATNSTMHTIMEAGREGFGVNPLMASVVIAALVLLAWNFSASALDPREPPEAISKIPFAGHLIGLLSKKLPWPIFTIRVFGSRIYVICSPELVHHAFRIPKALSFEPFIVESSRRAFSITEAGIKIIGAPPKVEGGESYLSAIHQSMVQAMVPGPSLLEMNSRVLSTMAQYLDKIGTDQQRMSLYRWTRDVLTISTANALYGPKNPISENNRLIGCLWDFENHLIWIMLQVLPTVLARKAYFGRAAINEAFQRHYAAGLEKDGSDLIKGRAEAARRYGLSERDIADFEMAILFASVTNTIPTSFWFLGYIVSSPSLLSEIRAEVSTIMTRKTIDGVDSMEMDITGFQKKCPILCSAWEETLRLIDSSSSVRMVTEDIMLADKYLLKAGSVVQMPSGVTHNSSKIWGDDVATFNARRFIRSESRQDLAAREMRKVQTQGYFPFGGGKHLCPGRHLAFTEAMGFVATLAYGFDISMADGSGTLKMPKPDVQKMGTGTRKPSTDVKILIKRREEFKDVKWTYCVRAATQS